jgi:hypothetical protein
MTVEGKYTFEFSVRAFTFPGETITSQVQKVTVEIGTE